MEKIIENICGVFPSNFLKIAIPNDSNYIFKPDVNYSPRNVFDNEGNVVTVNSFDECFHYVENGWDYIPELNNEYFLQNLISVIFFTLTILFFLKLKKYYEAKK